MFEMGLHKNYFSFQKTKDLGLFISTSECIFTHYPAIFGIERSCPLTLHGTSIAEGPRLLKHFSASCAVSSCQRQSTEAANSLQLKTYPIWHCWLYCVSLHLFHTPLPASNERVDQRRPCERMSRIWLGSLYLGAPIPA